MNKEPIQIYNNEISAVMSFAGENVLAYHLNYPTFQSDDSGYYQLQPVNAYYKDKFFSLTQYCNSILYKEAVELYAYSRDHGYPFHPYKVKRSYTVTFISERYLSLSIDVYVYTGGAHGSTSRYSNTWNISTGEIVLLGEFFQGTDSYENSIKDLIIKQIAQQKTSQTEETCYYPDYRQAVEKTFNKNNFYLTPTGIVVYFQQYDIAPYSSGIPQFLIPFPGQN